MIKRFENFFVTIFFFKTLYQMNTKLVISINRFYNI